MYYTYKITNKINGKSYIGYTKYTPEQRFQNHLKLKPNFAKCNTKFYRALQKYSKDQFELSTLFQSEIKEEALEKEKYYIKYYNTIKEGYNTHEGGLGGNTGAYHKVGRSGSLNGMYGKKLSTDQRKKISEQNKINYANLSEEKKQAMKNRMSLFWKGKAKSKEEIEKIKITKAANKHKHKYKHAKYTLVSPNNIETIVWSKKALGQFCLENFLSISVVTQHLLHNSQPSQGTCMGWKASVSYETKNLL
jgi:hypothetical protein